MAFEEHASTTLGGEADRKAPPADVLMISAGEAARMVGLASSTWWSLWSAARVPEGVLLGRRRLWSVDELRAWCRAGSPARSAWARLWSARRAAP